MIESDRWEAQAYVVIQERDRLFAALQDAESDYHDFILTKNKKYQESFNRSLSLTHEELSILQNQFHNNPLQQKRLEDIRLTDFDRRTQPDRSFPRGAGFSIEMAKGMVSGEIRFGGDPGCSQ